MKYVVGLTIALAAAAALYAGHPGCGVSYSVSTPYVQSQTVYAQAAYTPAVTYATPIVAATYIPVVVPTYAVGYVGASPATAAAAAAPVCDTSELKAQIKALEMRLSQLSQPVMPPAQPFYAPTQQPQSPQYAPLQPSSHLSPSLAERPTAIAVFQGRCFSCHSKEVAETKGAGFVMGQGGQLSSFTPIQAVKIAAMTYDGRMPKNSKALPDNEMAAVMLWLSEVSK